MGYLMLDRTPILYNPCTPEDDSFLQMRMVRYTKDELLKGRKYPDIWAA